MALGGKINGSILALLFVSASACAMEKSVEKEKEVPLENKCIEDLAFMGFSHEEISLHHSPNSQQEDEFLDAPKILPKHGETSTISQPGCSSLGIVIPEITDKKTSKTSRLQSRDSSPERLLVNIPQVGDHPFTPTPKKSPLSSHTNMTSREEYEDGFGMQLTPKQEEKQQHLTKRDVVFEEHKTREREQREIKSIVALLPKTTNLNKITQE